MGLYPDYQGREKREAFMKQVIVIIGTAFLVTACAGEKSTIVQSMKKTDKELSCTDVLLEMNEAEFYKNQATNNRKPSIKSVVMPLGYVSTYMDSGKALDAANSRIGYLNRVYEIMRCNQPQESYSASLKTSKSEELANVKQQPVMNEERQQEEYATAAPTPYVQVNPQMQMQMQQQQADQRYAAGTYGQPSPEMEQRYMASVSAPYPAPYADGYMPIRQRYEQRHRMMGQYDYGYAVPYEERIPEGAPVRY